MLPISTRLKVPTLCFARARTTWSSPLQSARRCARQGREVSRMPGPSFRPWMSYRFIMPDIGRTNSCWRCSRCVFFPAAQLASQRHTASDFPVQNRPSSGWRHLCRHCPDSRRSISCSSCISSCRFPRVCPRSVHQQVLLKWAYGHHNHCEPNSKRPN